jgi:cytochrome c553
MKKCLILFVALAMVTSAAIVVIAAENGPAEIKLPASMGEVTFDHAEHQGRVTDCTTCHHQGAGTACRSCHGVNADAPDAKTAFHNKCKTCHKEQNGPTKCKECHTGAKG